MAFIIILFFKHTNWGAFFIPKYKKVADKPMAIITQHIKRKLINNKDERSEYKVEVTVNKVVDAKGLACPMPIVKTKKGIESLDPGMVMEIQATDKGSTTDIKAWAENTGHQYLGSTQEDDVFKHYLRKASADEEKTETKHKDIMTLDDLLQKIEGNEKVTVIDVREPAEYAFGHIPGAINIPLDELEKRFEEMDKNDDIHVVCRTGSRSDLAAQKMAAEGFENVKNVVPGMKEWSGPTEQNN